MRAHPQDRRAASLQGIEALRAAAALAVVAYHAGEILAARHGGGAPSLLQNGAAGVDVFFVISGFVMVVSSRRLAGLPDAASRFARARLRRIVPLYWLCTGMKIAAVLVAPSWVRAKLTLGACIASLLFLPVHDAAGQFKPVLPVGWTLSFEMMFYALFAAALAARRPPALVVPVALAALTCLRLAGGPVAELGNPIVLEFAFGTTLAVLWARGWRLPAAIAWVGLAVAVALLAGVPKLALGTRVLSWGVPAAALVAACVSLERDLAGRMPQTVLSLGAASYAIYLTHGFVLGALVAAGPPAAPAILCVPLALVASAACGWLVHVAIERRLTGHGRAGPQGGRMPSVLVLAGGGLAPLSGGVGTLMRNLMDEWARTQVAFCIRIVDTRGPGGLTQALLCFAGSLGQVGWRCASGRTQLIHAHMTTRGSALRKAVLCSLGMWLGVPVILHMHGADFIAFHRRLPELLRRPLNAVLRRARHVVVLGAHWQPFLIREAGVDPGRICIIPNGVPLPAAPQRIVGAPARLIFLGRLCARKGVPELISALGKPCLAGKAWQATLAGDGPAAPYRAMVNWHRLQARVSLPGWIGRAEAAALLGGADVLVLPSHHEAMPVAVIEALAAGVAVVTTPVGAIPEFLEDGVSALFVQPGDPAGLARAIGRLLDDPVLRTRIAAGGHRVFQDRLNITGIAARVASLYDEAALPGGLKAVPEWARGTAGAPPALEPVAFWSRVRWGLEPPA